MKILGHEYEVIFDKEMCLRRGTPGSCCSSTLQIWIDPTYPVSVQICSSTLQIWIDPTYPVSVQQEALLHEIEEALKYHLNCNDMPYNHQIMSSLSEARYQVIKDNPEYFTFTLGKKK